MHYCPECDSPCYCGLDDEDLLHSAVTGCAHRCEELVEEDDQDDDDTWCYACDRELGDGDCEACFREAETDDDEERSEDGDD